MPEANTPAADPQPGTPEYDQMMASRFREMSGRGDENQPAEKPQRPEYVPEKFWDADKGVVRVEEMAKAHADLEKRFHGAQPNAVKDGLKIPEGSPEEAAKATAENAGLDWAALQGKMASQGKIDDADYAALEKVGVPRDLVDAHITMLKERSERATQDAISHAGGEQALNDLLGWAKDNLSDAEKVAMNKQLAGFDTYKLAIDTLMTRRAASSKRFGEPTLIHGQPTNGAVAGYQSKMQMVKDMSDPRYKTDPAFRAQVAAKVAVSKWDLDRQGA